MMFLYPLMLEAYKGIDFRPLLKSNLDGIEPEFIYKVTSAKDFLKKVFYRMFIYLMLYKEIF